jgi:hypothetical protein
MYPCSYNSITEVAALGFYHILVPTPFLEEMEDCTPPPPLSVQKYPQAQPLWLISWCKTPSSKATTTITMAGLLADLLVLNTLVQLQPDPLPATTAAWFTVVVCSSVGWNHASGRL